MTPHPIRDEFEPELDRFLSAVEKLGMAVALPELPGAIAAAYEVETACGALIDGLQAARRGGTPAKSEPKLRIEEAA